MISEVPTRPTTTSRIAMRSAPNDMTMKSTISISTPIRGSSAMHPRLMAT